MQLIHRYATAQATSLNAAQKSRSSTATVPHGLDIYNVPGSHPGTFEELYLRVWGPEFAKVLKHAQNATLKYSQTAIL